MKKIFYLFSVLFILVGVFGFVYNANAYTIRRHLNDLYVVNSFTASFSPHCPFTDPPNYPTNLGIGTPTASTDAPGGVSTAGQVSNGVENPPGVWTYSYDVTTVVPVNIAPGTYNVSTRITLQYDCGSTGYSAFKNNSSSFTIPPSPTCSISFSPTSYTYGVGNTTGKWSSSYADTLSYSCDYTAGGPLTVPSGSYTYSSTEIPIGSHRCTATATNSSTGLSSTCGASVVVNAPATAPTCSPSTQTVNTGQTASFSASGGTGTYSWSGGETPSTGSGSNFSTSYSTSGTKTVTVTSGSQTANCSVVVSVPTPTYVLNIDAALYPNSNCTGTLTPMGTAASSVRYNVSTPSGSSSYGVGSINASAGTYSIISATTIPTGYKYCSASPSVTFNTTNNKTQTITGYFAPTSPGGSVYCTASFNPLNVNPAGGNSTFSISATNATNNATYICKNLSNIQTDSGSITLDASGNGNVSITANQTKTCVATVSNSSGQNTCSSQVTTPPSAPTGLAISSSCSNVSSAKAVLSWNSVLGADHYEIYKNATYLNRTANTSYVDTGLSLGTKYSYYVSAVNSAGSANSTTVSVTTPSNCSGSQVTATLTANPTLIDSGSLSTLTWTSTNATTCTIDQGIGTVCNSSSVCNLGGTKNVSPTVNTTYTLNCSNSGSSASDQATVSINPIKPGGNLSCFVTAVPQSGNNAPLQTTLTATGSGGNSPYAYKFDYGDGSPVTVYGFLGIKTHTYNSNGIYKVTVNIKDGVGNTATCDTSVNTPPNICVGPGCSGGGGLSCSLDANPKFGPASLPVDFQVSNVSGGNGNYQYSFDYNDGQSSPYISSSASSHTYANAGIYNPFANVKEIGGNKTGTCSLPVGTNIVVTPPSPASCTFTASPSSILTGQSSILSWSCDPTGVSRNCAITKVSDNSMVATGTESGTFKVKPINTTQYNLSCDGAPTVTDTQATVNVGFIPVLREIIPR